MINPLKVATSGYLKRGVKASLIIAVAGYLNYTDVPPTPPSGGGGGYTRAEYRHYDDTEDNTKRNRERIRKDNETLLIGILKEWVTWQT